MIKLSFHYERTLCICECCMQSGPIPTCRFANFDDTVIYVPCYNLMVFVFQEGICVSNSPLPCEISFSFVFNSSTLFRSSSLAFFSIACFVLVDAASHEVRGLPVLEKHESRDCGLPDDVVSFVLLKFWYNAAALCNFKKQLLQQFKVSLDIPNSRDNESHAAGASSWTRAGNDFRICLRLGVLQPFTAHLGVIRHLHDVHTLQDVQLSLTGLKSSSPTAELQTLHEYPGSMSNTPCLSPGLPQNWF